MAVAVVTPEIERINQQLKDSYGIETLTGLPIWRVVFSDDQWEKRKTKVSPSGITLLYEQVFEMPKYQHVRHRWILEQLVLVPEYQQAELCDTRKSYECMFVFEHQKTKEPLPPKYEVAQFVIELVEVAKGGQFNVKKYTEDPEKSKKELEAMHEYLWGNETAVSDHLLYGTGVSVPSNYGE